MYLKKKLKSFRNRFIRKTIGFFGENNDKMRIFRILAKKLGRREDFSKFLITNQKIDFASKC